jgi:hypothetical protein
MYLRSTTFNLPTHKISHQVQVWWLFPLSEFLDGHGLFKMLNWVTGLSPANNLPSALANKSIGTVLPIHMVSELDIKDRPLPKRTND